LLPDDVADRAVFDGVELARGKLAAKVTLRCVDDALWNNKATDLVDAERVQIL